MKRGLKAQSLKGNVICPYNISSMKRGLKDIFTLKIILSYSLISMKRGLKACILPEFAELRREQLDEKRIERIKGCVVYKALTFTTR